MPPNHHEQADAYVHGLLTPAEASEFERLLSADPALQGALETARRRRTLLEAALPPAESSEALVQQTLERVDAHRRWRRRWRRRAYALLFAPAALMVLIVAAFHTRYETLAASPANLEVYGQNTLIPGSAGALRVRLTDRKTQAPLAGVPVEVTLGEPGSANFVSLASFTTDERGNGQPGFHLPDWADGAYPLRVTARTARTPEILTQPVWLKRSSRLLLTSDKPVYQPGQTIHVRSLTLRRPDLKPAAGAEASFVISDPRGNIIFRRLEKTSRFGIAAVDCPLSSELLEGDYRIICRVGDTDSAVAIRVEKYVLPRFRVTLTTDQSWYQPGQTVRATMQANYFHGKPAAGAEWLLEVTAPEIGNSLIARLPGRTDADGKAEVMFRLPATPVNSITLLARLRDSAGQEQTARLQRPVARQPFRLALIPENGTLVRGVANRLFVYASTPDGTPARLSGTVQVGDEARPFATGSLGVGEIRLPAVDERIALSFSLSDDSGRRLTQSAQLAVGAPVDDFLLRLDRGVYTSGNTMKVSVQGGAGPVFLDILKDDQTVRSEVIDLAGGKGELAVDLPAELFGTLQLCAYRFDAQGRAVRKVRTLFVRPARELRVGLKAPRPEFRPGEKARLEFTLADGNGQPVAGALSLAMVDEAVFDVRQQLPGLERTFYLLEQKLVQAATAVTPWSPEAELAAPAEERGLFEQAVFAGTMRAHRTIDAGYAAAPASGRVERPAADSGPHTLVAESYTPKQQAVIQERRQGLHVVHIAWIALALWGALGLYVVMWMNARRLYLLIFHGIAAFAALVGLVVLFFTLVVAQLGSRSGSTFSAVGSKMDAGGAQMEPASGRPTPARNASVPAIRVRERFPETMLWQPQLITDDSGHAALDLEFADSITTWRLSASAVSADGALGALQTGLRVFQPFYVDLNLPVGLTRGDEIDVPAVVSNFLPRPQTVELTLAAGDWFERLGADALNLELKPREVRSVSFRIRARKVGRHELQVNARSPELGDAVRRTVEVVPDGRRVEEIHNGVLGDAATFKLDLPADAIEGSGKAIVRIYPSSFSQVIDGLEGIFRLPTGCFEQTSSSLYPNVLALDYLRRVDRRLPAVEAAALGYIHSGYQRLLTFETPQGGFDWYGRAPGSVTLSAYGLMELRDMARVRDVDPSFIERIQGWLLAQRQRDGSWDDAARDPRLAGEERRLRTTAFVAWACAGQPSAEMMLTRTFLLRHPPATIRSAYVLALVCNALLAIDPHDPAAAPYLEALLALRDRAGGPDRTHWPLGDEATVFHGQGRCGDVETTALAALALLRSASSPPVVRSALTWIVEQRRVGNWGSTQATILALKALLEGAGKPDGSARQIDIALNGQPVQTLDIPGDQADVMLQVDLSSRLRPGVNEVSLAKRRGLAPSYQIEFRHHRPGSAAPPPAGPLSLDLTYDRATLSAGQSLTATARLANRTRRALAMVMLELPVPPGFRVDTEALDRLAASGSIDRYEDGPQQILVYLRTLTPERLLALSYTLRAGEPARLALPPARAWAYYDPDVRAESAAASLTVTPKGPR